MKLRILIDLAQFNGLSTVREAMQLAAQVTAPEPSEMNELRREVRTMGLCDADNLEHVKATLSSRSGREAIQSW